MYFLSHGNPSIVCKSYSEFHHLFKWEECPSFPGLNSSFDIQTFLQGYLIRQFFFGASYYYCSYLKQTLDIIVLTGEFPAQEKKLRIFFPPHCSHLHKRELHSLALNVLMRILFISLSQ